MVLDLMASLITTLWWSALAMSIKLCLSAAAFSRMSFLNFLAVSAVVEAVLSSCHASVVSLTDDRIWEYWMTGVVTLGMVIPGAVGSWGESVIVRP